MSSLLNPHRATLPARNRVRGAFANVAAAFRAIIALVPPEEAIRIVGGRERRRSRVEQLSPTPRQHPAWSWSLTSIMLAATLLRLIGLSTQSLTMDECFERDRTEMTIPALIHDPNSFPPLYHMILKVWLLFDDSEIALRTFSLACGLLALWALWWTVKYAIDENVAWWALLVGACSPFHIFYSQEGRVYMLYLLLSLLAVGCLLRWARDDSARYRAGFIAIAVLGGYVHYFFAIVLATLGLIAMIVFGKRFVFRRLLPVAGLIGVLCAPLFLIVSNDLDYQLGLHEPRPINLAATGYTYFSLASGYTLGVSRSELHTMGSLDAFRHTLPWAVAVGAVVVPLLCFGIRQLRGHWTLPVWLGLFTIPVAILVFLCVGLGVTYNTRFLVWLWIPYCVLLAAGLSRIRIPQRRIAVFAALALISGAAIYNRHAVERFVNEDVRAAADFILKSDQRPVLVCSAYMAKPLQYYLGDGREAIALGPAKPGVSIGESEADEYHRKPVWLVYSRAFHGDPSGQTLARFTKTDEPVPNFKAAGIQVFSCQGN